MCDFSRIMVCMGTAARADVHEEQLTGFRYFDRVISLFERLRPAGCERDKAGNRTLHFDQFCSLVLLYLFNPVVVSLRSLQQASELKKVQKKLGCARASLGSLSESSHVFEPGLLREIVAELGGAVATRRGGHASGGDSRHGDVGRRHAAEGFAPHCRSDVADDAHRHEAPRLAAAYAVRAGQTRALANGPDEWPQQWPVG